MSSFDNRGTEIEKTLSDQELGDAIDWVTTAIGTRSNPLTLMKWQFTSKKKFVDQLLTKNNLPNTARGLQDLRDRLENRMNLTHQKNDMRKYEWIVEFPEELEKKAWENWFAAGRKAIEARKIYTSLRSSVQFIELQNYSYDELWTKINILFKTIHKIPQERVKWEEYLSPLEIEDIINDKLDLEKTQGSF